VRAALAPALLLALACAPGRPPREAGPPDHPDELVATQDIAGDFLIRQRLRFRFGDRQGSFEAVVQKRCDEVTVVGLTPLATPAFAIHQRGLEVRVESHLPGPWPFSPRHVLLDVHRIYFLPLADRTPADGVHRVRRGGETVVERWAAGRLLERSFEGVAGDPPGRVVVTYPGGATRAGMPREVRLENEAYGYRIDVTTLSRTELRCTRQAGEEPSAGRRSRPPGRNLPGAAAPAGAPAAQVPDQRGR
jgi:hypothetical protein